MKLIGVEAGGRGPQLGEHAARFQGGAPGVLQGTYSYVLQDSAGQIAMTHSVSAGLDYPSIGPEHAWLGEPGERSTFPLQTRKLWKLCACAGAHRGHYSRAGIGTCGGRGIMRAPKMKKSEIVIVNISGRGDKDMGILQEKLKL